jgi:hypothetical protein
MLPMVRAGPGLSTGRDNNGDQSSADRPSGIERNTLTSPSSHNIDLTWNKIRTLRPERTSTCNKCGNSGWRRGSKMNSGGPRQLRPDLTFTRNLLNTQVRAVSGIQTSPLFGKAIACSGRAITAGLTFSF